MAKGIMIQGTSSNAGKSVMVSALCQIYMKRGYKVAPFKSQNMSLNSFTTKENGEIAIAQVLQAEACKIEPSIHMNPILLKPKGNFISQVIIQGKAIGDMDFYKYQHDYRETALKAIKESYEILDKEYDIIFIEGAGSPAEINMRDEDIANMEIAHLTDSEVLLVADIDRGGVFASIAGTFSLLDDKDRARLKGVIINKFSGNLDILQPGIDKIEEIINTPVLGVLPYEHNLNLPEEDSQSLREHEFDQNKDIIIGVIKLPKIANFTDIDPFESESDVSIKMINLNDDPKELDEVDAIIIPGTRTSTDDALALYESGLSEKIIELSKDIPIVGICGGYQILGNEIIDENQKESLLKKVKGLGLLDISTSFLIDSKVTCQSSGIIPDKDYLTGLAKDLFKDIENEEISGYELHEGTTTINKNSSTYPLFIVKKGVGNTYESPFDGACGNNNVFGTYFHGIFHNFNIRKNFLNHIRVKKGLKINDTMEDSYLNTVNYSLEKLAKIVEDNLDMDFIDKLIFNKETGK